MNYETLDALQIPSNGELHEESLPPAATVVESAPSIGSDSVNLEQLQMLQSSSVEELIEAMPEAVDVTIPAPAASVLESAQTVAADLGVSLPTPMGQVTAATALEPIAPAANDPVAKFKMYFGTKPMWCERATRPASSLEGFRQDVTAGIETTAIEMSPGPVFVRFPDGQEKLVNLELLALSSTPALNPQSLVNVLVIVIEPNDPGSDSALVKYCTSQRPLSNRRVQDHCIHQRDELKMDPKLGPFVSTALLQAGLSPYHVMHRRTREIPEVVEGRRQTLR